MTALGDGLTTTLLLLVIALLAHEPWRWLGLYLGRGIDAGSEIFQWVSAVSTALVAGLVMRLVLFPSGALADIPLWLRAGAFGCGIAVQLLVNRGIAAGVGAGALFLAAGSLLS